MPENPYFRDSLTEIRDTVHALSEFINDDPTVMPHQIDRGLLTKATRNVTDAVARLQHMSTLAGEDRTLIRILELFKSNQLCELRDEPTLSALRDQYFHKTNNMTCRWIRDLAQALSGMPYSLEQVYVDVKKLAPVYGLYYRPAIRRPRECQRGKRSAMPV